MHSDIDSSAATSDDGRWMTYDQIAALRRIDKPSVVKLATRHQWQRRKGNTGLMQVLVPMHWFDRAKDRADRYAPRSTDSDADSSLAAGALAALDTAVMSLTARAEAAEAARQAAEQGREAERQRVDDLRRQIAELGTELAVARLFSEQAEAKAQEAAQAAEALRQADAARKAQGLLTRLAAVLRGH